MALDSCRHRQGPQSEGFAALGPEAKEGPTMKARVAIYARVSTLNHGQDANLQVRELDQTDFLYQGE
jgi:predicted site-specific integrase-resolvase